MNIKTIGLAVLAGAMVAGCAKQAEEDVMAVSINGEKLMKSKIDADVATVVKLQGDKIPAEQLDYAKQMIANQIVQNFIIEKVLVAKAKESGFTVTDEDRKAREDELMKSVAKMPDAPKTMEDYFNKHPFGVERARAEFENGIMIDKMIKDAQAKTPTKDYTAEAKKHIDEVIAKNAAAKTADADALKKIQGLKAELDKTPAADVASKFAELAKANSACPSGQRGGDLGEFTHGQMVKEFDEAAFKLEVGKVSDPVKTQFGYHLIMTTKKIPAVEAKDDKPAAPEKVQASHILVKVDGEQPVPKVEEIAAMMKQRDERSFVQNYVQSQLRAAKIEASEEYKRFLPQPEPVEPPVEKTDKK